ncbi:unnamed protein product [Spirodela intermedia]|uniref:phosphoribosylglycinamide formyltransferase 1 n=1 Tax=Spirodela intermedia TaxID=51605 RepID=A0A7I8JI92_SPIIN|nr:unnamed protein product [Spirodela intermedia]CAA6669874.1 unnamed protein product [Spirodela intermedia]
MESARMGLAPGLCPGSAQPSRRIPLLRLNPRGVGLSRTACEVELHYQSSRASRKMLKCKSSGSQSEGGQEEDDASPRKKLAVFVSGGVPTSAPFTWPPFADRLMVMWFFWSPTSLVIIRLYLDDCGGAQHARDHGIPLVIYPKAKSSSEGLSPDELVTTLREFGVEFILLAGYLKLIPTELIQAYPRSILNIHPSLLPAFGGKGFYGLRVHTAVIAYSGATIHFVDEHYDTGRILAQRVVPVLADDTPERLAGRVLSEEHKLYTQAVEALCEGRISWRDDGVPLIQSRDDPDEYS